MNWIRSIAREILGLFVDDGAFALAILVWLATMFLLVPHFGLRQRGGGILLFAGLALILVVSALRFAAANASAAKTTRDQKTGGPGGI